MRHRQSFGLLLVCSLGLSCAGQLPGVRAAEPATPPAKYVPEPQPVTCRYDLGVFYFPGWDSMTRWKPILKYPDRKPLLGWYDESNPECVDWQIKWAVEHGVRFFMVDWYWDKGHRMLDHWIHKGFMHAKYRKYLNWCVMWANHNQPNSHSAEDWKKVTQFWIDNYFAMKEYYRVDGRPVVVIWAPGNIERDLGSPAKVAQLFAMSQEMAKKAGYKGIYFVGMGYHKPASLCRQWKNEGYEGVTTYHTFPYLPKEIQAAKRFPFAEVVHHSPNIWQQEDKTSGGLSYWPVIETGWANQPWAGEDQAVVLQNRTPEEFGKLCRLARAYADAHGKPIIALGPWNEWGEGSYIEPCAEFGFRQLDQLRAAFCEPGNYPPNLTPHDLGLGPYDLPTAPK